MQRILARQQTGTAIGCSLYNHPPGATQQPEIEGGEYDVRYYYYNVDKWTLVNSFPHTISGENWKMVWGCTSSFDQPKFISK